MDKSDTETLFITNKAREGYRRAGMAFAKGVNTVSANLFTEDQLAALEADPRLDIAAGDADEIPPAGKTEGAVDDAGVDASVTDDPLTKGMAKLLELVEAGELELNSSGKPNADALGVNAKQRDEIWADYQSQSEQAAE